MDAPQNGHVSADFFHAPKARRCTDEKVQPFFICPYPRKGKTQRDGLANLFQPPADKITGKNLFADRASRGGISWCYLEQQKELGALAAATVISDESLPSYNSDAGLIYGAPQLPSSSPYNPASVGLAPLARLVSFASQNTYIFRKQGRPRKIKKKKFFCML